MSYILLEGAVLGVLGVSAKSIYNLIHQNEIDIRKEWNDIMIHSGIQNKDISNIGKNKKLSTCNVYKYFKTKYGYDLIITLPKGLSYSKFEEYKPVIESGLKANIKFIESRFTRTVHLKVSNQEFDLKEVYKSVECEPYEIYVGRDLFKKDIIISMKDFPHVLITGCTNSGKSQEMYNITTNIINIQKNVSLWLAQVSAKKDVQKFKDCKQINYFAYTLGKSYEMFRYIRKIIQNRNILFNKEGLNNIYEYNKLHIKKNQMDYQYIIIDELKSFMVDDSKSMDIDFNIKKKCNIELQHIVQESRNCGIYVITCLQRSDKDSIIPTMKANFNTLISFSQMNLASARVTCDEPNEVLKLPQREAVLQAYEQFHIKTLYLDNSIINQYIKESIEKNHKYVDLNRKVEENYTNNNSINEINNNKNSNNFIDYEAIFIETKDGKDTILTKQFSNINKRNNSIQKNKNQKGVVLKDVTL